jgi:serine/threonine protein kinase
MKLKFPSKIFINSWDNLVLSDNVSANSLNIGGFDYVLSYFYSEGKIVKGGGNSFILQLNSATPNELSDDDLPAEALIKICKYPNSSSGKFDIQRIDRFKFEVSVLNTLKNRDAENIIQILESGVCSINKEYYYKGDLRSAENEYYFYVMELADCNLQQFLRKNELSVLDKLDLCYSILNGLKNLQNSGFYHRDIKHENILFVDGIWKISDLGLAEKQDHDKSLDVKNEKIGPYGWLSPEVMNKVLTEDLNYIYPRFDCSIDFQSDLFQLGKLFWYIFQENLPIGNIDYTDFRNGDIEIYEIILSLLQYSKERRPKLAQEVASKLEPIVQKYQLI